MLFGLLLIAFGILIIAYPLLLSIIFAAILIVTGIGILLFSMRLRNFSKPSGTNQYFKFFTRF
ncbi:MAG: hypothetical protein NTZ48_03545 [Candidatus Omnitrophica bacterium]|nr:hypothetical protein [Candidatus Omnitrophota bacterium]